MTMTPERLAKLDAVMANTTSREWIADGVRDNRIVWSGPDTRVCFMAIYPKAHPDSLAIVALHNAYPDLRAHIDAQAATIARLTDAITKEARAAEMSANIMRDGRRTGNWAGAEGTAKAFDRIKTALRAIAGSLPD